MMPGRFALGVGTGEKLNEHILGDRWPPAPVRLEMLEEAVDIIRLLWEGGTKDYYGVFYIGEGKPVFSEFTVCFADTEEMAKRIAYEYWPITANKGELNQELPTPAHFEQLASMVSPEDVVKNMPIGPDPQRYIDEINKFIKAGADHICLHQIGPNQPEFIQFIKEKVAARVWTDIDAQEDTIDKAFK
jgi:alkanesulfonate monooxygenase SsuD/methylene tetrahydromethanopterin reductase-like flavin-dependent oxidoreductase (luciferase family)